ncbi:hypothetical protein CU666_16795 [Pseudomonas syringae pv. actinidifoliorum]|nr:hypothetical protein [Pseudomonas syringae pv. actinidifoliorum]
MTFKCTHDPLGRTCVPAADTRGMPFAGQRLKRIVLLPGLLLPCAPALSPSGFGLRPYRREDLQPLLWPLRR